MSSNSRYAPLALGAVLGLGFATGARAAVDLAALQVTPQRGQSADQARRDRYECHNWAVEQTGVVPLAAPPEDEDDRARRAERIARVLNGVAIGSAIGGLVRATQDRNPAHGVLAGAAVGAAVGAATTPAARRGVEDDSDGEYLRALSACLEGRGYTVFVPDAGAETVAAAK
jgi:hypothetical protein